MSGELGDKKNLQLHQVARFHERNKSLANVVKETKAHQSIPSYYTVISSKGYADATQYGTLAIQKAQEMGISDTEQYKFVELHDGTRYIVRKSTCERLPRSEREDELISASTTNEIIKTLEELDSEKPMEMYNYLIDDNLMLSDSDTLADATWTEATNHKYLTLDKSRSFLNILGIRKTLPQNTYCDTHITHIPISILEAREDKEGEVTSSILSDPIFVDFKLKNKEGNLAFIIEKKFIEPSGTQKKSLETHKMIAKKIEDIEYLRQSLESALELMKAGVALSQDLQKSILKFSKCKKEAQSFKLDAEGTIIVHVIDRKEKVTEQGGGLFNPTVNKNFTIKSPYPDTSIDANRLMMDFTVTSNSELGRDLIKCVRKEMSSQFIPTPSLFEIYTCQYPQLTVRPISLMSRNEVQIKEQNMMKTNNRMGITKKSCIEIDGIATDYTISVSAKTHQDLATNTNTIFKDMEGEPIRELENAVVQAIVFKQLGHLLNNPGLDLLEEQHKTHNFEDTYAADLKEIVPFETQELMEDAMKTKEKIQNAAAFLYTGSFEHKGHMFNFETIVYKSKVINPMQPNPSEN